MKSYTSKQRKTGKILSGSILLIVSASPAVFGTDTTINQRTVVSTGSTYTLTANPGDTITVTAPSIGGSTSGGAMLVSGNGILNATGSISYSDNHVTGSGNGGAIGASSGTALNFTGDISFLNNTSSNAGGALFSNGASTIFNGNVILTNNVSRTTGGAFYLNNHNLTINGTLSASLNRTTTPSSGGAIFALTGSVTISSSVTMDGNSGANGGAIWSELGIRLAETVGSGNVSLTNNLGTGNGGAIYSNNGGLILGNTGGTLTLTGNQSLSSGGISNTGYAAILRGSTITVNNNRATGNGGSLYVEAGGASIGNAGSTLSITGNSSDSGSGGFSYTADGGTVTVSGRNIEIRNNTAVSGTGGVFRTGGSFTLNLDTGGTLVSSGNKAAGNTDGGFLYANRGNITFNIGDGAIASVGDQNSLANGTDSISAAAGVNLYKEGTGTLVLAAANTYSGTTYAEAGTLQIDGSIAGGADVSKSATLQGTGLVSGNTIVNGTLAPGNGIGSINFGNNLTLTNTAKVQIEIDHSNINQILNDMINVAGILNLGEATLNIDLDALKYYADGSMITILTANELTGEWGSGNTYTDTLQRTWTFGFEHGAGVLSQTPLNPIPEPSYFTALFGGAVAMALLLRRKRK